jgi:enoyl-[acyl-carrier protein] reductase III
MNRTMEGKVALVTGGSRGIGRAISTRLAGRGCNLVVAYLRNRSAAEATCAELEGQGNKVLPIRADVGDADDLDRLFTQITDVFGRLDVFVSNAATGVIKPFDQLNERAWNWTMDANAKALYLGALRSLELMHDGGNVIALSSQGASKVLPGYSLVGTSKAAIETLVRYLAVELAPRSIRVNAVSPGVVDTDALRHFPMREEMLEVARDRTPAGRLVEPSDVASAVDFLIGAEAAMITGQTLVIDGGVGLLA